MKLDETTREEAARWFTVLRRGPMTLEERQSFDAWRTMPLNQRALDSMHELWGEMSAITSLGVQIRRVRRPPLMWRAAVAAAAVVTLVGAGGGLMLTKDADARVSTRVGEQQTKSLPDGSVVALNVLTSITYDMEPHRRAVRLREGEAAFFVKKDAARPFVVLAGDYEVRAVGTAFNIRRRDGVIDVAVSEGIVRVTAARGPQAGRVLASLSAGERLQLPIIEQSTVIRVTTVPVQSVGEWRLRVVDYEDVAVATVAADLNRFYPRPIVVGDADLARRRVTLRLQVDERDETLRTLAALLNARVRPGETADILVPAAAAGPGG